MLPTFAEAAARVSGTATTNDIAISLSTAHRGLTSTAGVIVSLPPAVLSGLAQLKKVGRQLELARGFTPKIIQYHEDKLTSLIARLDALAAGLGARRKKALIAVVVRRGALR
jgi:hypothetical protein